MCCLCLVLFVNVLFCMSRLSFSTKQLCANDYGIALPRKHVSNASPSSSWLDKYLLCGMRCPATNQSNIAYRLQLKPGLLWYSHHPKLPEMVPDARSRAEDWTDLRKIAMRVTDSSRIHSWWAPHEPRFHRAPPQTVGPPRDAFQFILMY